MNAPASGSLGDAIVAARQDLFGSAQAHKVLAARADAAKYRPVLDLVVYLKRLAYELRLFANQLDIDSDNRVAWEAYLAQLICETGDNVGRVLNEEQKRLVGADGQKSTSVKTFSTAAQPLKKTVAKYKDDKEFWQLIREIRNGHAAHHGLAAPNEEARRCPSCDVELPMRRRPALPPMTVSVAWITSCADAKAKALGVRESQLFEAAVSITNAITAFERAAYGH